MIRNGEGDERESKRRFGALGNDAGIGRACRVSTYAEGQVWAYHTRAGEEGSLLKIQRIEIDPKKQSPIYHISVIGFHLANPRIVPMLPHAPVSQQSLDMSVTRLVPDPGRFPSVEAGIARWRGDKGGVYIVSIATVIELLDRTLMESPEQ